MLLISIVGPAWRGRGSGLVVQPILLIRPALVQAEPERVSRNAISVRGE